MQYGGIQWQLIESLEPGGREPRVWLELMLGGATTGAGGFACLEWCLLARVLVDFGPEAKKGSSQSKVS